MTSFQLSYDYRCPFAKNIHLHVISALRAGGEFEVTFVPWTMSEGYRGADSPNVWDDPARDDELLALAVSVSVRDLQAEHFLAAHEALFRARHESAVRLTRASEIAEVLGPLGVDLDSVFEDVASRRPHAVIGESYRAFERYEAFGVPTFVVGNDATFVRYMTAPSARPEESLEIVSSLVALMTQRRDLNEFKHTTVPF